LSFNPPVTGAVEAGGFAGSDPFFEAGGFEFKVVSTLPAKSWGSLKREIICVGTQINSHIMADLAVMGSIEPLSKTAPLLAGDRDQGEAGETARQRGRPAISSFRGKAVLALDGPGRNPPNIIDYKPPSCMLSG
jgi:hypothetical protein